MSTSYHSSFIFIGIEETESMRALRSVKTKLVESAFKCENEHKCHPSHKHCPQCGCLVQSFTWPSTVTEELDPREYYYAFGLEVAEVSDSVYVGLFVVDNDGLNSVTEVESAEIARLTDAANKALVEVGNHPDAKVYLGLSAF